MFDRQPRSSLGFRSKQGPAAAPGPLHFPSPVCFPVFLVYLLLRAVAWRNTTLLEDHDSLSYLVDTEAFLTFDLSRIIDLDPDSSLFYPLVSALFCFPGWPAETGARLASFASAILLFFVVLGIGRRLAKPAALVPGLLLLACSPELISLSPAVLTEPSYIAVVYLGLWLFWTQYKNPTWPGAALLGLVFGLAFLNRMEGILFAAFVPLMLVAYHLWARPVNFSWQRTMAWSLLFLVCFSFLAGLQVWRVSNKMSTCAINGRQAWTLLLHADIGTTYDEKIYGLHFSPERINIGYLKENAGALNRTGRQENDLAGLARSYARTVATNAKDLYDNKLNVLIGMFALVFFAFGLLGLHQSRQRFELFLILSFILVGLTAPLLHNVVIRHILVVAPIMLLVAGIGMDFLARSLLDGRIGTGTKHRTVAAACLLFVFTGWIPQLRDGLNPPDSNWEYSPAEIRESAAVVRSISGDWQHRPLIAARKNYLAYYAGADTLALPYADYPGLLNYSRLNKVDFLYLNHGLLRGFPFLNTFKESGHTEDFRLVYRGLGAKGQLNELYQFTGDRAMIPPAP